MNMPGMDSCTVLHRIKNHTGLRSIPVVMFSLDDTDAEICQCYSEQVNAYI